jgi:tetratricopeptide (TPR) repeat protein
VQQGIPAVIAMQFEVTDEAAICFTREFYAAIASGYPVDAALAESRKAIFAEVSEIEWGTPVLYMRSPDGKVFEIEKVNETQRRELHIASLVSSARTAAASSDGAAAIATLKEALALEPSHAEASALLRDLTQEKELEDLYGAARVSYDAARWREALDQLQEVQGINRAYRDVATLVANAERELARLDGEARRQQELETLYTRACHHADRRNWREALATFRQLQRLSPDYKDVLARLTEADTELNREAEEQLRAERASADRAAQVPSEGQRTGDANNLSMRPRAAGWLFMGGAVGAVAIIAILITGITLAVIVVGRQDSKAGPQQPAPVVQLVDSRPAPAPAPASVDPPRVDPKASVAPPAPAAVREERQRPRPAPVYEKPVETPPPAPVRETPPPQAQAPQPDPKSAAPVVEQKTVAPVAQVAPPVVAQNPTVPPPMITEPPVVTPVLRATLEAVIRRGDELEVQAFSTLNPQVLALVYSGKALQRQLDVMKTLVANGVFMVARLHSEQFESFSVSSDGRRAQVRLTPVWSSNFHNALTRQCVGHHHEMAMPQTLFLELTNRGWLIYDVDMVDVVPPLVACH